jgi:hypothetical protein
VPNFVFGVGVAIARLSVHGMGGIDAWLALSISRRSLALSTRRPVCAVPCPQAARVLEMSGHGLGHLLDFYCGFKVGARADWFCAWGVPWGSGQAMSVACGRGDIGCLPARVAGQAGGLASAVHRSCALFTGLPFALSRPPGQADKRFQLADWRLRPLTPEMLHYARADTHFLLYCFDKLKVGAWALAHDAQRRHGEGCLPGGRAGIRASKQSGLPGHHQVRCCRA